MLNYNAPIDGQKSSIDGAGSDQMNTFFWLKKAIIEARKEQYFMPLASVTNMPKHFGKTIKVYEYVPLLDERNVNDQGIDANGATIVNGNLYGSSKDVGTITSYVRTIACVNRRLHYHASPVITPEDLKAYNCPIEVLTHGDIPHRVLEKHNHHG